jgi:hypothetical protein
LNFTYRADGDLRWCHNRVHICYEMKERKGGRK